MTPPTPRQHSTPWHTPEPDNNDHADCAVSPRGRPRRDCWGGGSGGGGVATNPARSGSERPLPEEAAARSVVEGAASARAVTASTSPAAATAPSSGDGGASPAPNDSDPPLSLGGADRDDSGDSTAASGPELEGWPEDMASSSTVMGTTLGSASSHVTKEPLLMLPGCTTTYFLSGHSVTCSRRTPHVIQWGDVHKQRHGGHTHTSILA